MRPAILFSVASLLCCSTIGCRSKPTSSADRATAATARSENAHLTRIDPATGKKGGVSANGKILWLSGRYNSEVYAIDTEDGHPMPRIPVGKGPHGLCVYPQPGRYSLGHTGVFR